MTTYEFQLNKFAQDKVSFETIINWFDSIGPSEKEEILERLSFFLLQSYPTKDAINTAVELLPIKKTVTPAVIFKNNSLSNALNKIKQLPENESRKAFITMLYIFKVSDTLRRENDCAKGCSHEWHNLA